MWIAEGICNKLGSAIPIIAQVQYSKVGNSYICEDIICIVCSKLPI